ncbi:hypothetical protein CAPTEDRAFT_182750 [Capitella teleta]|uniref:Thymidine kinase n=1 Tax=Capitella teleta TaxID=283909 RepID=R7UHL5_CAPTE|nr:hypothetical protein CAPTEDRAFT_182750 [Capitella teleta]|eukprot:ELU05548.1 hypothetical protein CAPTEDRAFT_182750 [Capitella teleta]
MMACSISKNWANLPSPSGQIQVIFGPMFSGKTTELVRRMKRFQIANYSCLLIKYANDTRYTGDEGLATHDKQVVPAVPATKLKDLWTKAEEADVIGVDEGQFFPDTVEFCEAMANKGKTVIVAALDGTFQREGFGDILKLVPLAESVIKLTAVCMQCYGEAAFTKRKGHEMKLEVIGGADMYLSACRACHKSPAKVNPLCSPRNKVARSVTDHGNAAKQLFRPSQDENRMEMA